jgi:hypothetical protein
MFWSDLLPSSSFERWTVISTLISLSPPPTILQNISHTFRWFNLWILTVKWTSYYGTNNDSKYVYNTAFRRIKLKLKAWEKKLFCFLCLYYFSYQASLEQQPAICELFTHLQKLGYEWMNE